MAKLHRTRTDGVEQDFSPNPQGSFGQRVLKQAGGQNHLLGGCFVSEEVDNFFSYMQSRWHSRAAVPREHP